MANHIALRLDRLGIAEMSCIAGLGGDVPQLVRKAQSGRPLLAIDGCPLQCVRRTFARHALHPHTAITLSEMGVRKCLGQDFDPNEAEEILGRITAKLIETSTMGATAERASGLQD